MILITVLVSNLAALERLIFNPVDFFEVHVHIDLNFFVSGSSSVRLAWLKRGLERAVRLESDLLVENRLVEVIGGVEAGVERQLLVRVTWLLNSCEGLGLVGIVVSGHRIGTGDETLTGLVIH